MHLTRPAALIAGLAVVTAGLLGPPATPATAQTALVANPAVALPSTASQVSLGDVDGDGDLDQVIGFDATKLIGVLLGDGAGGFGAVTTYPIPAVGVIGLGDLDSDGDADAVVTLAGQNRVAVLRASGGGFGRAQTLTIGIDVAAVAVADVTSDGRPDIVGGGSASRSVAVLVNTGSSFTAPVVSPAGRVEGAFAVRDVDADGQADVLVADRSATAILLLTGHGDGNFDPPVTVLAGSKADEVTLADLDADGLADIVGWRLQTNGWSSPVVTLAFANGDGTFRSAGTIPTTTNTIRLDALTVADMDSDGRADVVVSSFQGLTVMYGAGGGRLLSRPVQFDPSTPPGLAVGDLDGDGDNDVATAEVSAVSYRNVGLGALPVRFANPVQNPSGLIPVDVVSGDFDDDGNLDAVAVGADGAWVVLLGDGTGRLLPASNGPGWADVYYSRVAAGDIDGDGNLDIAIAGAPGVRTFFGDGLGGLSGGPTVAAAGVADLTLADLASDGHLDLVLDATDVDVAIGDGTGAFAPPYAVIPRFTESLAVSDLDADGNLDIATYLGTGGLAVVYGDGLGTFTAVQNVPSQGYAVRAADVTGDGRIDLVTDRDTVPGQAGRTFGTPIASNPTPDLPGSFELADVDGDGRLDRVTYGGNDLIAVQLGGNGTFAPPLAFLAGGFPGSFDTGDYDADGREDIMVGARYFAKVSVLLNTTT